MQNGDNGNNQMMETAKATLSGTLSLLSVRLEMN